ncbi:hypothetical protein [uncultured Herbaspirillum sp.]|uniref:hypothetical protein n=1 Tax=uncultured Herbaspirillum sp. TaxID=160236 RepID=UPI0032B2FB8F
MHEQFDVLFAEQRTNKLQEQTIRIQQSIEGIKRSLAAKGSLNSGARYKMVFEAIVSELIARSDEILSAAYQASSVLRDIEEIAQKNALQKITHDSLEHEIQALRSVYLREIDPKLQQALDFDSAASRVLAKNKTEVALHFAERREKAPSPNVFNTTVHGPVGAIQSGSGSSAVIHQTVNADVSKLFELLNDMKIAINASTEVDPAARKSMLDHVEQCSAAVKADKPNRFTVKGLISGLKDIAGIVPNVQTTYKAIEELVQRAGLF